MDQGPQAKNVASEGDRKELIELAQFVLSRRTRDIRSELTSYLIARIISKYAKERDGLLEADLIPLIEVEYRLPRFPELFVHSALEEMVSDGSVLTNDSSRGKVYFLDETKQREIESLAEKYGDVRKSAMQERVRRTEADYGQLSKQQTELLVDVFYGLIGVLLAKHGMSCAEAIVYRKRKPVKVLEYPDFRAQLDSLLWKIGDRKLRESFSKVLQEMFQNPNADLLTFLHSMAQGYVILQILNLDPNCIQLERASLERRRVYLDTNIVIALVCLGEQFHQAMIDLIKLTRKLGVQLVFSSRTKTEFLLRFKESTELYQRISGVSKDVTRKVMELMPDPFIKSYRIEKGVHSQIGWEWFDAKMQNIEVVLKDQYEIEYDQKKQDNVDNDPDLERLIGCVFRAAYPEKSDKVARHDAFHLFLVNKLRNEETTDELGTNYWFLTLDNTLERAEREFAKGSELEQWLPANIHASTWLDMVSTFLSPDVAREEPSSLFARLLATELPALIKPIDSYDIADLTGAWMDDPSLGTDTLRKIVGNEFVRGKLALFREARSRGEATDLGDVITPIMATVKQDLDSKYTSTIGEMKKEIEKLKSIDERFTKTRKPLLIFGSLSFGLLAAFSLIEAIGKWHFPEITYTSLLILTIVLLGSATFGRSVLEKYLS